MEHISGAAPVTLAAGRTACREKQIEYMQAYNAST